jgi:hypothetical protein
MHILFSVHFLIHYVSENDGEIVAIISLYFAHFALARSHSRSQWRRPAEIGHDIREIGKSCC